MKKADKKPENIKKGAEDSNKLSFIKDEKFRVAFAMFLFVFAVIVLICQLSYLFTWQEDADIVSENFFKICFSSERASNIVGTFGAFCANFLIHDLFGIASFSIIPILFLISLQLITNYFKKLFLLIIKIILYSLWISLFFATIFGDDYFNIGGAFGLYVSEFLQKIIGLIGTYFFLFISLFVLLIYTIPSFLSKVKQLMINIFKKKDKNIDEEEQINENPITDFDAISAENNVVTDDSNIIIDGSEREFVVENKTNEKSDDEIGFEVELTKSDQDEDSSKIAAKTIEEEVPVDIIPGTEDDDFDNTELKDYDPTEDLSYFKFPSIEILNEYKSARADTINSELQAELKANTEKIIKTLADYKIDITIKKATIGPTVTLYEVVPKDGVRIAKIKALEDDIALRLAASGVRIEAPIPGRGTVGIEVPNAKPEIVSMRSILKSEKFLNSKYELPVAMGKTISNETYVFNLAKTPHLLMAGATGQGKSVGVNAIIASLLYKKHPSQLKFVLVDPKMVELSLYNKIEKNYLAKLPNEESAIITDVTKVVPIMNSLCILMDERYKLLTMASVRNINEYNEKFIKRKLSPNKGHYYMPYIVVVIDEFADIIVQEGKQIEAPISRLAAKARAIGIHLIVATQRPSIDVITGVIKANFPTRIAFKVTNIHDSKTILDQTGANQLIGKGDMLISENGQITRLQCAFIDTPEVESLVNYIGEQQSYSHCLELPEPVIPESDNSKNISLNPNDRDELFTEAAHLIVRHQQGSTSLIQRKMSLGYNRAGRIMDQLEAAGIVGPYEGSKARQVNFPDEYSLEQFLNTLNI